LAEAEIGQLTTILIETIRWFAKNDFIKVCIDMDKNNLLNDAGYDVTSMKSSARYWFKREFCDIRHGKDRSILDCFGKSGLERWKWGGTATLEYSG
jgi:hypothetical protein